MRSEKAWDGVWLSVVPFDPIGEDRTAPILDGIDRDLAKLAKVSADSPCASRSHAVSVVSTEARPRLLSCGYGSTGPTVVICAHTYTHQRHMRTHVHTCAHTYAHQRRMCTHTYTRTHTHTRTHMYTHVHTCTHHMTHMYTSHVHITCAHMCTQTFDSMHVSKL